MRVLTGAVLLLAGSVLVGAYVCAPRPGGASPQYISCVGFVGVEGFLCQFAGFVIMLDCWRKDFGEPEESGGSWTIDLFRRWKNRGGTTPDSQRERYSE